MDTNLEKLKRELIAITKYSDKKGIDYEKYEKEKSLYECVNLPFEIGELSGKHLDFLDKLLSLLLALLSMLQFSYPEQQPLTKLFDRIIQFRGFHWALALMNGTPKQRMESTAKFIQYLEDDLKNK